MKPPRVRLARVMIAVALVAINLAVLRENHLHSDWTVSLVVQGSLPMANALILGLLIGRQARTSRPFFLGFAVAGALALATFVLATNHPRTYPWVAWYADLAILSLEKTVTRERTAWFLTLAYLGVTTMLGIPQLIFAMLGGRVVSSILNKRQGIRSL